MCHSSLTNNTSVSPKDPSRNHRAYRLTAAKLEPPLIPFMPLLIKGNLKVTHPGQVGGAPEGVMIKMKALWQEDSVFPPPLAPALGGPSLLKGLEGGNTVI